MTAPRRGHSRSVVSAGARSRPSLLDRVRSLLARRWFRRGLAAAAILTVLGVIGMVWAYAAISLPAAPETAETTVVLDADGNVLAELYDVENRATIALDEVAPVMRDAVVAAEDQDFYRHTGLDPIGIGRAVVANVRGKPLQGGSTITQQLVKNTWLSPERSLVRKAKEAILAVKVEREWSKDEILERYLNTVYFGRGAYGIEKAAEIWFGVRASELTLPEAALLAGLIRAPESADPAAHPDVATRRREIVLDAMVEVGSISRAEADAAAATPVTAQPKADPDAQLRGSSAYFIAQVRRWLVREYGEQTAFGGGLTVHTTLRPALQTAAERAVFDTLNLPDDPDAALVSVDERGAVVAMIGGRDFAASKVNLALGEGGGGHGRQPGSTFKPFVLAAALEAGIPVTQRYQGPAEMTVDVDGIEYPVENYDGESFGELDLVEATARSVNTVYAQLVAEVHPQNVADVARDLGITAALEPHPSIALGAEEVSPLDMATAYMTFGLRGQRVTPFMVEKVVDSAGNVIHTADTARQSVYPRQYADVVNYALQQVIDHGTGRAAAIGVPAAGKTGTTSSNTDAWFVGYTPHLSTAIWMGYKDGTDRKMTSVHGRAVTGGSFPAQMWSRFMGDATADAEPTAFEDPPADLLRPAEPPATSTTTSSSTSSTSSSSTTSTTDPDETTTSTTPDEDVTTTTTDRDRRTTTTTEPEPTSTTTTTPTDEQSSGLGGGG